jgi:hypothetical protein
MMQMALGWLRWTPDAFWGATMAELDNAIVGYMETRGVKPRTARVAELDELLRLGREAVAAERRAAKGGGG